MQFLRVLQRLLDNDVDNHQHHHHRSQHNGAPLTPKPDFTPASQSTANENNSPKLSIDPSANENNSPKVSIDPSGTKVSSPQRKISASPSISKHPSSVIHNAHAHSLTLKPPTPCTEPNHHLQLHRRHRLFRDCHDEISNVADSPTTLSPATSTTILVSPPPDSPAAIDTRKAISVSVGDLKKGTPQPRTPRSNSVIDLLLDQVESGPAKTPMAYWHEFKRFVIQTRVLETGVGVIVGRAFQEVVRSFVNDLFVPPIAAVAGDRVANKFIVLKPGRTKGKNFKTIEEAIADGAITLNYGRFVHQSINFLAVGLSVYWFLRALKTFFEWRIDLHDRRPCPKCLSEIPLKAQRCAFCHWDLPASDQEGERALTLGPSLQR